MTGDPMLCDEDNAVLEAIRKRLADEDPLNEDGRQPRHCADFHLYWHGERHWHSWPVSRRCTVDDVNPLSWWAERHGPLTICDCPC